MISDEMVTVSAADLRLVLSQHTRHAHQRARIWDSDNRPGVAGTRCMECDARDRLIGALESAQRPAEGGTEETS
jgi:hypothetical protein